MGVFVKSHRRGKSIVKAYSRSSIVRSQRLVSLINRIGKAKVRASRSHFNVLNRREDKLSDALALTIKVKKIKRDNGSRLSLRRRLKNGFYFAQ